MLLALVVVTLLLWLATGARAARAVAHTPVLRVSANTSSQVAVFVPVRDEIAHLADLLRMLELQQDVMLDVWVYDDGSSDGSSELLDIACRTYAWLHVVHGSTKLPEAVFGKPHALAHLVETYPGNAELWLFLDADVVLHPQAIAALVAELRQHHVDLVSPLPTLAMDTFWAMLLGPNFASVATMPYPPERVNDDNDRTAFFNGQVALMRREAYLQSGGFAAVQSEVLEDVALAKRLKHAGARLRIVDGQSLFTTHMYRTLGEHVHGWGKNIFELVGRNRRRAYGLAFFLVLMAALPLACLASAFIAFLDAAYASAALALLAYLLPTAIQIAIRARAKAAPFVAPLALLGASIVAWTLVRAALQTTPVHWKGRQYAREDDK